MFLLQYALEVKCMPFIGVFIIFCEKSRIFLSSAHDGYIAIRVFCVSKTITYKRFLHSLYVLSRRLCLSLTDTEILAQVKMGEKNRLETTLREEETRVRKEKSRQLTFNLFDL